MIVFDRYCIDCLEASGTLDTVETVYRAIDQELGKILTVVGANARVAIFSTEAMCSDNFDLPNMVYLPELMFRYSFPGCTALDFDPRREPSPESQAGIKNWVMEVWHHRRRARPIETWMRDRLPLPLAMKLFRWLGLQPPLFHPTSATFWNFQATTWANAYRPYMKAFALISASDGCIRLNVRGRERRGMVAAEDFRQACDEITGILMELRDPETGLPAVRKVLPMRSDPLDWSGTDYDADLIVLWNSVARTRLTSPRFGKFGPVPYHRTSAHTPHGFIAARGPGIAKGSFPTGSPLDVAPTLLKLAGSRKTSLPGRCLISVSSSLTSFAVPERLHQEAIGSSFVAEQSTPV